MEVKKKRRFFYFFGFKFCEDVFRFLNKFFRGRKILVFITYNFGVWGLFVILCWKYLVNYVDYEDWVIKIYYYLIREIYYLFFLLIELEFLFYIVKGLDLFCLFEF